MTRKELEDEIRKRIDSNEEYNPSPNSAVCNWCGVEIDNSFVTHCVQKHGKDGFEIVFYCSPECLTAFNEECLSI